MGEVDGAVVEGDETGPDQPFQYDPGVGGVAEVELGVIGGAAGVRCAGGDEAEQDPAGQLGLRCGEFAVHLLCRADDGAVQFTGRLVRALGQHAPAAVAPSLQQGVRHHRQSAGGTLDLVEEAVGQGAFDDQAGRGGRADDGLPQLGPAHRTGEQGGVLQRGGEAGVFGAPAEEVGPHRDDDPQPAVGVGGGDEAVDEGVPLGRVATEGVQLLELVDDQPGVGVGVRYGHETLGVGAQRVRAGREDAYGRGRHVAGIAALTAARGAQPGDQPGPQQRGLAAAGRAEDRREAVFAVQLGQPLHELVPAEEQIGVARFEPGQATVGRPGAVVGRGCLGGQFVRHLAPAPLPLAQVAAARLDVRERHRAGGQLLSGGRLRQGGHAVPGPLGHRPVGGLPRGLAQGTQFGGEARYRSGLRIKLALGTPRPRLSRHVVRPPLRSPSTDSPTYRRPGHGRSPDPHGSFRALGAVHASRLFGAGDRPAEQPRSAVDWSWDVARTAMARSEPRQGGGLGPPLPLPARPYTTR